MKPHLSLLALILFGHASFCQTRGAKLNSLPSTIKTLHLVGNAVKLDADILREFSEGFAVISKGSSDAMIDKTGKIVIPYNKYKFAYQGEKFTAGLVAVLDPKTQRWGVINTKLEVVLPCLYSDKPQINRNGTIQVSKQTKPATYLGMMFDRTGKLMMSGIYAQNQIGLSPYQKIKFGFVNQTGKIVIPEQFEVVTLFSEGLAAVAKNDQFGNLKWGFIDETGKLVIPYMFSNRPGSFFDGLAIVQPATKDEFKYAYIDKTGAVVIKVKDMACCSVDLGKVGAIDHTKILRPTGSFLGGYSLWEVSPNNRQGGYGLTLLDKKGNYYPYIDLLKQNGWPFTDYNTLCEFTRGEVIISSHVGVRNSEVFAIANTKGEILLATALTEDTINGTIYGTFEPVSGLARVMLKQGNKRIEGYANRNGEMVIIIDEPSRW